MWSKLSALFPWKPFSCIYMNGQFYKLQKKSLTSSWSGADSGTKQTKFSTPSNSHGEINSHAAATGRYNGVGISTLTLSSHSQSRGIQQPRVT